MRIFWPSENWFARYSSSCASGAMLTGPSESRQYPSANTMSTRIGIAMAT